MSIAAIGFANCTNLTFDGNSANLGIGYILPSNESFSSVLHWGYNPNMSLRSNVIPMVLSLANSATGNNGGEVVVSLNSSGANARFDLQAVSYLSYLGLDANDGFIKFSNNSTLADAGFRYNTSTGLCAIPIRNFIAGVAPSWVSNTSISVTAGQCNESGNTRSMIVAAGTIDCTTVGANGLDAGSLTASTWYVTHAIGNADQTSSTALLASTSLASPALPTGYVYSRPIGFFKTDASAHIIKFVAESDGETVYWADTTPALDINASGYGTAGALQTLARVPPGIKVKPILWVIGGTANSILSSPDQPVLVPSSAFGTAPGFNIPSTGQVQVIDYVFTNTSAQLYATGQASGATMQGYTVGWRWDRGRGA